MSAIDSVTGLLFFAAQAAWILLLWCVLDGLQGLYRGVRRKDATLRRWSVAAMVFPCIAAVLASLPMYLDTAGRPAVFPFKPIDVPGYVLLVVVCLMKQRS